MHHPGVRGDKHHLNQETGVTPFTSLMLFYEFPTYGREMYNIDEAEADWPALRNETTANSNAIYINNDSDGLAYLSDLETEPNYALERKRHWPLVYDG